MKRPILSRIERILPVVLLPSPFYSPTLSCFARTSVRLAVIADYGSNSSNEQAVADLVKSRTPDVIITTGDNSYGWTTNDINLGKYYREFIGKSTNE